jgi:hypothetical protein
MVSTVTLRGQSAQRALIDGQNIFAFCLKAMPALFDGKCNGFAMAQQHQ